MPDEVFNVFGRFYDPDGNITTANEFLFSTFSTHEKAAAFASLLRQAEQGEDYDVIEVEAQTVDEDANLQLLYKVHYYSGEKNSLAVTDGRFVTDDTPILADAAPAAEVIDAMDRVLGIGYGWSYAAATEQLRSAVAAFYATPAQERPTW